MDLALLLLFGALPTSLEPEYVDLVEVNHLCDDQARQTLWQVIFWEFSYERSEFQVRSWRLVRTPGMVPRAKISVFADEKAGGKIRVIQARSVAETWTQYDPEVDDRGRWPEDKRRGLR